MDLRIAREVAREALHVRGLVREVDLECDRARELLDDLRGRVGAQLRRVLFEQRGQPAQDLEVGADPLFEARPPHLHRDFLAREEPGAVYLRDRRRGDRHVVELGEEFRDRTSERALDLVARRLGAERRHRVLQFAQLDDEAHRDQVGPRREDLAELHEGGAQLFEGHPDPLFGRVAHQFAAPAAEAREAARQLERALQFEPRDQVAETELHDHAQDLAQALQVLEGARDADERAELHG